MKRITKALPVFLVLVWLTSMSVASTDTATPTATPTPIPKPTATFTNTATPTCTATPTATDVSGLTIKGDFIQSATSTLVIEVNGTNATSATGILNVTGNVTLDGVLDLRFVDGHAPGANDVFSLIACEDALSGDFSEVWISGLLDGFEYTVNTDGGAFEIIALNDGESLAPGDTNGDGNLDYGDLFLFAHSWHEQRNAANANCNLTRGDSAIDEKDLLEFLSEWK